MQHLAGQAGGTVSIQARQAGARKSGRYMCRVEGHRPFTGHAVVKTAGVRTGGTPGLGSCVGEKQGAGEQPSAPVCFEVLAKKERSWGGVVRWGGHRVQGRGAGAHVKGGGAWGDVWRDTGCRGAHA